MVSPIYSILDWIESELGITNEGVRLFLVFSVGVLGLTALIAFFCGKLSETITRIDAKVISSRYAAAFVPLGAGIWIAHYGFHFLIGALTIFPVMHTFLIDRGIRILGTTPNWDIGFIVPMENIFPFQVGAVIIGFFFSLYLLGMKSMRNEKPSQALMVILPWAIVLFLLTVAALSIFNLPMEMRGAMGAGM
jgi:hypothetical protein